MSGVQIGMIALVIVLGGAMAIFYLLIPLMSDIQTHEQKRSLGKHPSSRPVPITSGLNESLEELGKAADESIKTIVESVTPKVKQHPGKSTEDEVDPLLLKATLEVIKEKYMRPKPIPLKEAQKKYLEKAKNENEALDEEVNEDVTMRGVIACYDGPIPDGFAEKIKAAMKVEHETPKSGAVLLKKEKSTPQTFRRDIVSKVPIILVGAKPGDANG